jgi:hypothetical protein
VEWLGASRCPRQRVEHRTHQGRAVDQAASVAAATDAKLVIATAYKRQTGDTRAADILKGEGYLVQGAAPVYAMLRGARDRAKAAGTTNVEERAVVGGPVGVLVDVAVLIVPTTN